MNFPPPSWVREAAEEALSKTETNHYSHPKGRLRLRNAIRDFYGPSYGRELNPDTEILVTSGANEGTDCLARNLAPQLTTRPRTILRLYCFPRDRRRGYHV